MLQLTGPEDKSSPERSSKNKCQVAKLCDRPSDATDLTFDQAELTHMLFGACAQSKRRPLSCPERLCPPKSPGGTCLPSASQQACAQLPQARRSPAAESDALPEEEDLERIFDAALAPEPSSPMFQKPILAAPSPVHTFLPTSDSRFNGAEQQQLATASRRELVVAKFVAQNAPRDALNVSPGYPDHHYQLRPATAAPKERRALLEELSTVNPPCLGLASQAVMQQSQFAGGARKGAEDSERDFFCLCHSARPAVAMYHN